MHEGVCETAIIALEELGERGRGDLKTSTVCYRGSMLWNDMKGYSDDYLLS